MNEIENKSVEPKMVTYAKEIYSKKNKGNFNNFIYGKAKGTGKFVGSKRKKKRILR